MNANGERFTCCCAEEKAQMNNPTNWANLPCEVPGYNLTLKEYATLIQELIAKGDFIQGKYYLDEYVQVHGSVHRLTLALIRAGIG
jgi:hypothetical protein